MSFVIYRALRPGQLAARLDCSHEPLLEPDPNYEVLALDEFGRRSYMPLRFVEDLPNIGVVKRTDGWYSRHLFVVLPDSHIIGPTDSDFEEVRSFYSEKLGEAFQPPDPGEAARLRSQVERLRSSLARILTCRGGRAEMEDLATEAFRTEGWPIPGAAGRL